MIFFCILFNAVSTLSEVGLQYSQRPIVNKQKGFGMYHPFIDSLASIFSEYPFKAINVGMLVCKAPEFIGTMSDHGSASSF